MDNHIPSLQSLPMGPESQALIETMIQEMASHMTVSEKITKRGRPAQVNWQLLSLSLLWCVLRGWQSQLDLWRQIRVFGFGPFAAVAVCDQAIYNRLAKQGSQHMQRLCVYVSQWLFDWMAPYEDRSLAPFARQILALDESKLDSMKRWVQQLREMPTGDHRLLAGRLCCLFDVRRQQWQRIDLLPKAIANCQAYAREMLASIERGTLLLFDLGYYNLEWFDDLTERGIWWISRVRKNSSLLVQHILVQKDGYMEALVFVGEHRSNRAKYLVRLVRLRYRGQWYSYISNVCDPCQLTGAQIVRLYARRWDIELGFRLLKDHLQVRCLWSAKAQVIGAQIWAGVILAQMLHASGVQIASQAGIDVFDVSLDLLMRYMPDLLRRGIPLASLAGALGSELRIIRPSTRIQREVPTISWQEISWAPPDLVWRRPPHYAHNPGPHGRAKRAPNKSHS